MIAGAKELNVFDMMFEPNCGCSCSILLPLNIMHVEITSIIEEPGFATIGGKVAFDKKFGSW